MSPQQPLFDEINDAGGDASAPAGSVQSAAAPVWLQRMSLVVLVLFCFVLGTLIAVLPWSPDYWQYNEALLSHPGLSHVLHLGWLRGLISGIGLLDIWIGVAEALHYRDHRMTTKNGKDE
jgi:hypothetical protein